MKTNTTVQRMILTINTKDSQEKYGILARLTNYISRFDSLKSLEYVTEIDKNGKLTIRNRTVYKFTEIDDNKIAIESEVYEAFLAIFAFLNSKGIDYKISELALDYQFSSGIEDIAILYTKQFPDIMIEESLFVTRDTPCEYCNLSELKFTFKEKELQDDSLSIEAIVKSLDSCEAMYPSRENDTVVQNNNSIFASKDGILSIDFNEQGAELLIADIQELFHLFKSINTDQIDEYLE